MRLIYIFEGKIHSGRKRYVAGKEKKTDDLKDVPNLIFFSLPYLVDFVAWIDFTLLACVYINL